MPDISQIRIDGITYDIKANGASATAAQVSYDDTQSQLDVNNVQDAIDSISTLMPILIVKIQTGSSITITKEQTTITGVSVAGEFETRIPSSGVWTVSCSRNGRTASDSILIETAKIYEIELTYPSIYGVEWRLSGESLSRTDDSALFTDPVAYVNGGASGSSPFDNIYPWKDMVIETIDGNSLVKIPKFWVKLTKTSSRLSIKIADGPIDGFIVSPAHRDRGDGEKDFVYIGRYHSDYTYKSVSGQTPIGNITRAKARTNTHNLGTGYWQLDISMWITIWFLYLVEFANWNSQACIGYNCSYKTSTGSTDTMPYHTGTMQTSRTTYGAGVQYRYIEDLWGSVEDWCDGIIFRNQYIYCFKDFTDYSDSSFSKATYVGTRSTYSSFITDFGVSSINGFEWFMYPSATADPPISPSGTKYDVPDFCGYDSSVRILFIGYGSSTRSLNAGLFRLDGSFSSDQSDPSVGVRLQYIPSSNS